MPVKWSSTSIYSIARHENCNRFRNSPRNSHTLNSACNVLVATERYQTCTSVNPGCRDNQMAGKAKMKSRTPVLMNDGQVLPSA